MEPVLATDQIQANILPGFRLPWQMVLALEGAAAAPAVVAALLPDVTPMAAAVDYHRRRIAVAKARRTFGRASFTAVQQSQPLLWLNLALDATALVAMGFTGPAEVDRSFKLGLAARSLFLGDPRLPGQPGHRDGWVVGATGQPPSVLVLLGSDDEATLRAFADEVQDRCRQLGATVQDAALGMRLEEDREHFGFKDGISQPGLRGTLSTDPEDFLTPRKLGTDGRVDTTEFAAPGEVLLWPGEVLFGYDRQDPNDYRRPLPSDVADAFLSNGAFLVYRRLRQDVFAFRAVTNEIARALRAVPELAARDDDWFRARLVGRWPSGAPLGRFPDADPGPPPGSLAAYNHFGFTAATMALETLDGEPVPGSPADPDGFLCPHFAHIRKVHPRDAGTNQGPPTHNQILRLLRRGITYGPPAGAEPDEVDRGLLFLAYMRSIRGQFEVLTQDWMNSAVNPEGGSGHDILVGQERLDATGRYGAFPLGPGQLARRFATSRDWILPTGGGYFFAPSLDNLAQVAALAPQV